MKDTNFQESSSGSKPIIFALLSSLLGLAFALLLAEWALGIYSENLQSDSMDEGLVRYHALLGWSLAPDWQGMHHHHDYEANYSTNNSGFRNQTSPPVASRDRVTAVLGDSFTFGLGVNDDETFVSRLNQQSENTSAYINYAIPGTSTDQQIVLLSRLLASEHPDDVLLVVYLPNDLLDNTLEFPLQAQQGKPRFLLSQNQLTLTNTPVPLQSKPAALQQMTMGSIVLNGFDDSEPAPSYFSQFQLYRLLAGIFQEQRYEEDEAAPLLAQNLAPALTLFTALLDNLKETLDSQGIDLQVAILPGREAMINTESISHHFQNYLRQEIVNNLGEKDINYIDLMELLSAQSENSLNSYYYPNDGHLTPEGHNFVALKLAESSLK